MFWRVRWRAATRTRGVEVVLMASDALASGDGGLMVERRVRPASAVG